jgi:hypothetical protein
VGPGGEASDHGGAERTAPLTPEAQAALRQVEATYRRRHQWVALCRSVVVSVHTMIILHTLWDSWPLDSCDMWPLAFLVVNALSGVGFSAWSLRGLRTDETLERRPTLDQVRWQAERRAWFQPRQARRDPREDASPC